MLPACAINRAATFSRWFAPVSAPFMAHHGRRDTVWMGDKFCRDVFCGLSCIAVHGMTSLKPEHSRQNPPPEFCKSMVLSAVLLPSFPHCFSAV
jgi:hypothetical protein